MSGRIWLMIGALSAALAVTAGAFGAHKLQGDVDARKLEPKMLEIFETAARYQMYHALALVAVGLLAVVSARSGLALSVVGVDALALIESYRVSARSGLALSVAGWSFLIGTVLFSGSLYALVFTGIRWLGAITPIGGVAFIVGWIALAVAAYGAAGQPSTSLGE